METPIEAELAEKIHDYLCVIHGLGLDCEANPVAPMKVVQARSLMLHEIPKLVKTIEMLSQSLVKLSKTHQDATIRLEAIRTLETICYDLIEALPRAKKHLA